MGKKKLKKLMDEIHSYGAKMFVQLTAGFGRSMAINPLMEKASTNKFLGGLIKPIFNMKTINGAPSATPNRWSEQVTTRPLTEKEILKMIEGFARTAKLRQRLMLLYLECHLFLLHKKTLSLK